MSRRSRRRPRGPSRRRHPRWQVPEGRLVGAVMRARVLDMGAGGARIETSTALRVGAPYNFKLELPGTDRRVRGRVRWCRLVATREAAGGERLPVYRAGIVWDRGR